MKKLLYIILLLPLWVNAQNVTMNKTNGYLRTLVSGTAVDSVMMSFGTGVNGYIPIYNSTLKKNVYTNPNTIIPTQYWQRSGTTLSPLTAGDNISTTGNITGAAGSFASLSSVASNGISGSFTNNSTGFATIKATNSGSGNLAEFANSGGVVASISNSGVFTGSGSGLSGVVLTSGNQTIGGDKTFSSIISGTAISLTNNINAGGANFFDANGGFAFTPGGTEIASMEVTTGTNGYYDFRRNSVSKWNIGLIGSTRPDSYRINNPTTTATSLEINSTTDAASFAGTVSSTPQGTLYGTATGSITSAQLATSLTDETGTGSAVFSASPTFTGTLTGTSATFTGTLVQQNITDGVNLFGQNTQEGTRRANLFSTNSYTAFQTVGATSLQFGTNGVDRYTIDASGNNTWTGSGTFTGNTNLATSSGVVGIGTASPTSGFKLEVRDALPATFISTSDATAATYGGVRFSRETKLNGNGNGFQFASLNSSDATAEYGYFGSIIESNTASSENGTFVWMPAFAGVRTERMRLSSSGDLEIGGSNATKASGTAWINPSDLRLKTNVGDYSKGLAEVLAIKPKTWYFNQASGFDTKIKHLSPIAQELKLIMPEMVSTYKGKLNGKSQELLQVDASDMTWLLVKAIQEQQAIIEKLNERITLLEKK